MEELEKLKLELKGLNSEYAKIKDVPAEKRGEFGRELNAKKNEILAKIKECSLPIYLKQFSGFKCLRGKDQIKDMEEN